MRARRFGLFSSLFAALALALAACGEDEGGGGGGGANVAQGDTLTVYSSLPRQGATRTQTLAVENGIKLALEQSGGKAGQYNLKYVPLDDSTAQAGAADPGQTSANARRAVQDRSTIGYIGEFNSGASVVSIPILNEGGIPQISPANTAVGLTSNEPGAEPGEPDKYYPTGKRTYARVVPKDTIQGAALATDMKQQGCTKVYILNDKSVYGAGLARNTQLSAEQQGMQVLSNEGIDPKAANYRSVASKIQGQGADCVVFSGTTDQNGVQVFKDVAAGVPNAKLFGPDGVAEEAFTNPKKGGIPESVARRTRLTVATLDPESYPPEGRQFFEQFEQKYNQPKPDPYAIYGYEAMSLLIDAIKRAGARGNDRQAVLDQIFQTRGRKSVLGTYDIDRNGDTSLTDYGVYTIEDGQLAFDRAIKASR